MVEWSEAFDEGGVSGVSGVSLASGWTPENHRPMYIWTAVGGAVCQTSKFALFKIAV